jgi:hypothetical protein
MLLIAALLVTEVLAIRKDRAEHDDAWAKLLREEIAARSEAKHAFAAIRQGIQTTIQKSDEHFDKTMRRSDAIVAGVGSNIKTVTGGDSYCYVEFANRAPDDSSMLLMAVHRGHYPLRDVRARMVDEALRPSESALARSETQISIGDLAVGQAASLGWRQLKGPDRFNFLLQFSALNGSWDELIHLRMVKGEWQQAVKVFRYVIVQKGKLSREKLLFAPPPSTDYPLVNGKVGWEH